MFKSFAVWFLKFFFNCFIYFKWVHVYIYSCSKITNSVELAIEEFVWDYPFQVTTFICISCHIVVFLICSARLRYQILNTMFEFQVEAEGAHPLGFFLD